MKMDEIGLRQVDFMLLELKPSYIVVGDVTRGPQLFSRGCWRLIDDLRPADVPKAENLSC